MDFDLESLNAGLTSIRSVFGLVKEAKEVLPAEKQKVLTATMEQAELNFGAAEVAIAKGFGYNLCQCTFPPQIMLSIGFHDGVERYRCARCQKVSPEIRERQVIADGGF